jgi:tetratricopeptide (TPR) repeat protein
MPGRILVRCAFLCALLVPALALADPAVQKLMDQNHWRRARALLEPKLQANPEDPVLVRQMTRVLIVFDESDPAIAMGEKAVKLAPNDAQAHMALAEAVGDKAQNAGKLKQLGLAKRFKKEAEAAIALDPKQIDARMDLISFYMQAPGIAGGDKKKAKALVDEIERIKPEMGWQAKIRHAGFGKDSTVNGPIFREAATKFPNDYDARLSYASWLMGGPWRGPAAEAESHARAALALDPERTQAYTLLAIQQAREKKWDELDRTLAESAAKIPDDLSPVYQAGRICLTEHGDGARAEKYFRRYLSQPPEMQAVGHAAARWRLGLALEKQGKKSEAIAEMQTATRLDPKFEPVKKDLKRLKG